MMIMKTIQVSACLLLICIIISNSSPAYYGVRKKYLLSKIIWIFCYDRGAVVPSVVEEVEVVVAMDIEELVGEEEVEGEEDLHSQLLDHCR